MQHFFIILLLAETRLASKIMLDDDKTAAPPTVGPDMSCFDKELNCNRNICQQFPEVGKEKCAKTCGYCDNRKSSHKADENAEGPHKKDKKTGAHLDSLCFDRKLDCTNEYCRDHYQFAREQCARTCGFCTPDESTRNHRDYSQPKIKPKSRLRGFGTLDSICFDRDLQCTQEICRDYRDIAREICAKTCGFC